MAAKKITIEVSLVSVKLANTLSRSRNTKHIINSGLVYPRPSVALKSASQTCEMESGCADLTTKSWCGRVLFKEQVEGTFGLKVSVTRALTDTQLEEFFRYVAALTSGFAADFVEDRFPLIGLAASVPFKFVEKQLGKSADYTTIASGDISLDPAALRDGTEITVPLIAPVDLSSNVKRAVSGGKGPSTMNKVLLRKDSPNGEARLLIKIL